MNWTLVSLLPNLSIDSPIETSGIAIVPFDDIRLQSIAEQNQPTHVFIKSFHDPFGGIVRPAALIRLVGVGLTFSTDDLVAYRNLVAQSVITQSWHQQIRHDRMDYPRWSDCFDFYPISVNSRGKLAVESLDLLDERAINEHRGQSSPHLSNPTNLCCYTDKYYYEIMVTVFNVICATDRTWPSEAFFRSLELSFLASTMPKANATSVNDQGIAIALWISALEILVRTPETNSSHRRVHNLLGQSTPFTQTLRDKEHSVEIKSKDRKATLVQKLCAEMYAARDDFLHGNPVSRERLYPMNDPQRWPLGICALFVYRTATIAFLRHHFSETLASIEFDSMDEESIESSIAQLWVPRAI